jgi:hypothetical protein
MRETPSCRTPLKRHLVGNRRMIPESKQEFFELDACEKALGAFPGREFLRMVDELHLSIRNGP